MSSYIGNRGYTIFKNTLTEEEETKIKTDLCVKPYVPKLTNQKVNPFPIYRESGTKYYLPKFYGLQNFQNNIENNLSKYETCDPKLTFKGELRPYQDNIVSKYISP